MNLLLSLPLFYKLAILLILSTLSSWVIIQIIRLSFPRLGLLDNPAPYGHKRAPVPLGAGMAFYLNFLIFGVFLFPLMTGVNKEKLLIVLFL